MSQFASIGYGSGASKLRDSAKSGVGKSVPWRYLFCMRRVSRRSRYRIRRLGALIILAVFVCGLYPLARADADSAPERYVVSTGDSLWTIATEHYTPSEDPRIKIEEIRELNDLEGYRISAGDRLELPPA